MDFGKNEFVLMSGFYGISTNVNYLFHRYVTLVLAPYTDDFFIVGNMEQFIVVWEEFDQ
jgi:hypothetical protein